MMIFSVLLTAGLLAAKFIYFKEAEGWQRMAWRWGLRPIMWGAIVAGALPFPMGFGTYLVQSYGIGWLLILGAQYLGFASSSGGGKSVERGTEIVQDVDVQKMLKRERRETFAEIGTVPVPVDVETHHFLFSGSTGSGKTLAFNQLLLSARERKQRAIIADPGASFLQKFGRESDRVFNPFDERGVRWCPFAEMRQSYDAARLAASMIPEGHGDSREWNGYARTILETVLERLFERGETTNQALVYYLLAAPIEELADLCEGSAASAYFAQGAERMLGSIRGILSSYAKPYTYLDPAAGADAFSVRRWIEEDGGGWLFLTFRDDQLKAIRPTLAAILDIASSAVLSLPPDLDRRIWFALDEFATLGFINSIEPLLTKGRKNGAAVIIGIQAISQLRETYGREGAQTLLSCLSTWLVLKQPDAESAEYMSQYLGDEEARRIVASGSDGGLQGGRSEGWSEQYVRQRAILPAELQNLEKRIGIVNIAGAIPPAWTEIPIIHLPDVAEAFQDREGVRSMRLERPATPNPAHMDGKTLAAPALDLETLAALEALESPGAIESEPEPATARAGLDFDV